MRTLVRVQSLCGEWATTDQLYRRGLYDSQRALRAGQTRPSRLFIPGTAIVSPSNNLI